MGIGAFLRDRALYVWQFWNGVLVWFKSHPLPDWLSFLDPLAVDAPMWKTVLLFGVYALIYLGVCLLLVKIAKLPLMLINAHMNNHGVSLVTNMPLYIIAIGLVLFDELVFGSPGVQDDGNFHIGAFTLAAGILMLIAVFRMLRRAGLRFIYFIPLQMSLFAIAYLYVLLFAPAAVILLCMGVAGAGMAAKDTGGGGQRCPYCHATVSPGQVCECGNFTGGYGGIKYPNS